MRRESFLLLASLTNIGFISQAFANSFNMNPQDVDEFVKLARQVLSEVPGMNPKQKDQLRKDIEALAADIRRYLPHPGAGPAGTGDPGDIADRGAGLASVPARRTGGGGQDHDQGGRCVARHIGKRNRVAIDGRTGGGRHIETGRNVISKKAADRVAQINERLPGDWHGSFAQGIQRHIKRH